jgi:hypothetical protein
MAAAAVGNGEEHEAEGRGPRREKSKPDRHLIDKFGYLVMRPRDGDWNQGLNDGEVNDLRSKNDDIGVLDIVLGSSNGFFALGGGSLVATSGSSFDGDLDGDGPATNFLSLKGLNGLLLSLLATDIHKAIALAPARLTPAGTDNARRPDFNASIGEESSKRSIVNAKAQVGHKDHRLRRFANGILASGTRGARRAGLLGTLLLGDRGLRLCSFGAFSCRCSLCGLAFWGSSSRSRSALEFALKR